MKDDTISRAAAIKAADSIIERDISGNNDVVKAMTAWKEYIKGLPPTWPDVPGINVGKMCEYYDLCRNGRDEKKLREELLSAQPECEDDTKSHSEKDILNGCISLLEEMVCHFKDYMEWVGYEPDEEEKEYGYFGMTYFHIVQHLFLWHTRHAGGTSTREKCYELGIDEPSDGVRFPLWDDEDGEQDD